MSTVWKLVVFSSAFHIGEAACSASAACTEKETTSSPSLVQANLKKYKLSLSDENEKLVEEDSTKSRAPEPAAGNDTDDKVRTIVNGLHDCLEDRRGAYAAANNSAARLAALRLVFDAEVLETVASLGYPASALEGAPFGPWPTDPETIAAETLAGKDAALIIAEEELEHDAELFVAAGQTPLDHQKFASKISTYLEMCGEKSKAKDVADAIDDLEIKVEWTHEEAQEAMDLAANASDACTFDSLDLSFFVRRSGAGNMPKDCSALLETSLLAVGQKRAAPYEFYTKVALGLHDSDNQLGHHFVQHVCEGQRNDKSASPQLMQRIRAAVRRQDLSSKALGSLHVAENAHAKAVFGATRDEYCEQYQGLKTRDPHHWIIQSSDLHGYVNCLCSERRPFLECTSIYESEIQRVQTKVQDILRTLPDPSSLPTPSLLGSVDNASSSGIFFGPCSPPSADCELCMNNEAVCMSTSIHKLKKGRKRREITKNVVADLAKLFDQPQMCVSGSCEFCVGLKPGDPLSFKLKAHASTGCGGNIQQMLAGTKIGVELSTCLGGKLGDVISKIGLDCRKFAGIDWWPFLNKVSLWKHFATPVPLTEVKFNFALALGDIAEGAKVHCRSLNDRDNVLCHKAFYDARGATSLTLSVETGAEVDLGLAKVSEWHTWYSHTWNIHEEGSHAKACSNSGKCGCNGGHCTMPGWKDKGCYNNCPRKWSSNRAVGYIGYFACEAQAKANYNKYFSLEANGHCWLHSESSPPSGPDTSCDADGEGCKTHVYEDTDYHNVLAAFRKFTTLIPR